MPSLRRIPPAAADSQSRAGDSPTTTLAALADSADVEKVSTLDKDPVDELAAPAAHAVTPPLEDEEVPPAPHFPDGGTRAYLNTLGGVLVLFSTFGLSNSWAVFQAHLAANQLKNYPASTISWIGSVQLFALFLLGLPSGRLFDSGYFRYQLAGGSILWCFGMYMLSLSSTYYQFFLSYAVCLGIALGILFAGTISCVGSYFKRKRTLMMGCTAGGAALGAVLFPIALNNLFQSRGFGFGVRVLAYIHTALLILANILMRPRDDLPPRKAPPILPQIASFLSQPQTWFASLGCAFVMLGMFIPIFYIQVFAEEHDASETVVRYCVRCNPERRRLRRPHHGRLRSRPLRQPHRRRPDNHRHRYDDLRHARCDELGRRDRLLHCVRRGERCLGDDHGAVAHLALGIRARVWRAHGPRLHPHLGRRPHRLACRRRHPACDAVEHWHELPWGLRLRRVRRARRDGMPERDLVAAAAAQGDVEGLRATR